MLEIIAPAIRILLMTAFIRTASLGWWTPQDAETLTKVMMDLLVYGGPIAWAWWAMLARRRELRRLKAAETKR